MVIAMGLAIAIIIELVVAIVILVIMVIAIIIELIISWTEVEFLDSISRQRIYYIFVKKQHTIWIKSPEILLQLPKGVGLWNLEVTDSITNKRSLFPAEATYSQVNSLFVCLLFIDS